MKRLLSLLICAISSVIVHGQPVNHVPNPSFEEKTSRGCPAGLSGLSAYCESWRGLAGSSDYFNFCAGPSARAGVPTNQVGSQFPASGIAYSGILVAEVISTGTVRNYTEYLANSITPVVPGKLYRVSFSISLADTAKYAINELGVYFSNDTVTALNPAPAYRLAVTPQVKYDSLSTKVNSTSWTRLSEVYLADSAYRTIAIGRFKPDNQVELDTILPAPTNGQNYCYYYFDSVVIEEIDSIAISMVNTTLCAGDTFTGTIKTFSKYNSNNVFTVQLSDKLGSFSSVSNIGTLQKDTTGNIVCVIPPETAPSDLYRLRLLSSSSADTFISELSIKIGNLDSANVEVGSNGPVCIDDSINLTLTHNDTGLTYSWTGVNNFNSTQKSPTIYNATSANSGNYYTVTKYYGCTQYDTVNVVVKANPDTPNVSSNSILCSGDSLKLTAINDTSGVTYSWSGPNSFSSTIQNPILASSTITMTGIYTATSTKNGCSSSDTTYVQINQSPPNSVLTNNGALCAGDTLKLTLTNTTSNVTYSWIGPNSFTSTTQNPNLNNVGANASGWYKGTVTLNVCSTTDSTNVVVNSIPAQPVLSYNNPLCVGETLQLSASSVSGATYSWAGPNGYSSTTRNPIRNNAQTNHSGIYGVVTSRNGCEASPVNMNVTVNAKPFVVIFGNKDSICKDEQIRFSSLANNVTGGNSTYQWHINAQAVSGATQNSFNITSLNNGDIITCKMLETTKCSVPYTDESNSLQPTVMPWLVPTVSISVSPTGVVPQDSFLTFTANPTNEGKQPKYQWTRNGGDIIGATGNVWSANTLNDNDRICLNMESDYRCPNPRNVKSNCIDVKILSSVNDVTVVDGLKLYPNPNTGLFVIEGMLGKKPVTIQVMNSIGQLVYTSKLDSVNRYFKHTIDLPKLPNGMYLLKLTAGNKADAIRFSIER